MKRRDATHYCIESHTRYLHALRSCQRLGTKLGHRMIPRTHQVFVAYVLDGKVWEFSKGVILGPEPWEQSSWRWTPGDLALLQKIECRRPSE